MAETNNYAKTRGMQPRDRTLLFFTNSDGPPALPTGRRVNWWLWRRPDGADWREFRLIGEGVDDYCALNHHVPGLCDRCRAGLIPKAS